MTDYEKLMAHVMSQDVRNAATVFVDELVSSTMLAVRQDPRAYGFVTVKEHDARATELLEANNREVERRRTAEAADFLEMYPLDSYHEDFGSVLWWKLPVDEPPYCGMPEDGGWPGYHTHWSKVPNVWKTPLIIARPRGACL